MECEYCGSGYRDWEVDIIFWEKLPINMRPLNLCEKFVVGDVGINN